MFKSILTIFSSIFSGIVANYKIYFYLLLLIVFSSTTFGFYYKIKKENYKIGYNQAIKDFQQELNKQIEQRNKQIEENNKKFEIERKKREEIYKKQIEENQKKHWQNYALLEKKIIELKKKDNECKIDNETINLLKY